MPEWDMLSDTAPTRRPPSSPRLNSELHAAFAARLPLTPAAVIALQRLAGNRAVAQLLAVQRRGCDATCSCGGSTSCAGQERETEPDVPLQRKDDNARQALAALDRATAKDDPQCQAALPALPPWMPNLRRRSPVELGKGTKRQPMLKAPDGPSGDKCRGACGPDCPDTCKNVGSYAERYTVGHCSYLLEFPNALLCGTHAGCRTHDACYDAAVANGESYPYGPRHNQCNQDAVLAWGPDKTKSWMHGGDPYDDWWYFVDDPVIRQSSRIKNPPKAAAEGTPSL
ncbi:MAG: hypothetical protein ACRDSZ_23195 [Pseudonocardiaceae bacterium]